MVNIYDSANQLASDIQKIDEFAALQKAIKDVENNETSSALFKRMNDLQGKIMEAQSTGKELSQEDQQAYKDLGDAVQKDAEMIKLLQAEQALYKVVEDVQGTITKPINDLYQDLRK